MRALRAPRRVGRIAQAWLVVAVVAAAPAFGQDRPTLDALENRVDQQQGQIDQQASRTAEQAQRLAVLEAFLCETSSRDSFRPLACTPACNCSGIEGFAGPTSGSCQETSHGEFSLSATVVTTIPSSCGIPLPASCDEQGGASFCNSSSGPCVDGADCSAGELCTSNVCLRPCTSAAECPSSVIAGYCDRQTTCTSNSECLAPGDGCLDLLSGGGVCSQSCTVDADCDISFSEQYAISISGVGAVSSSDPATCDGAPITSRDALECVSIAEAGLGACTYLCGDGALDPGEECDDGNRISGDGCDAACNLET